MSEHRRGDFYLIFLGLVLGYAGFTLFAPHLIEWWSKPPYQPGFDCTPAISWGLTQIIRWQIAGMILGALSLWLLSAVVRRKRVEE